MSERVPSGSLSEGSPVSTQDVPGINIRLSFRGSPSIEINLSNPPDENQQRFKSGVVSRLSSMEDTLSGRCSRMAVQIQKKFEHNNVVCEFAYGFRYGMFIAR
jgi:hypothetical protein